MFYILFMPTAVSNSVRMAPISRSPGRAHIADQRIRHEVTHQESGSNSSSSTTGIDGQIYSVRGEILTTMKHSSISAEA